MSRITTPIAVVGIVALLLAATLVGAGLVLGAAGPGTTSRQLAADPGGSNGRTVTVSASGSASAPPDEALVRVSVESAAPDPTVARRRVAANASSLRRAMADLGLPPNTVRTTGYDLYEDRGGRRKPGASGETTYHARHTFAVRVDDVGRVGEVIDAAVDNGATSVHGVRFTLSDATRTSLRKEATRDAMERARDRASTVAGSAGLTLTGVRAVRTGTGGGPRPYVHFAAASGGSSGASTDVQSGPVTVGASVTVTYNATG